MKRVLITGHAGYLGYPLFRTFRSAGWDVVGLDTGYFGNDCVFFEADWQGLREIRKDLRRIREEDFKGVDVVCHLAALSNDPMGELNKDLTYEINHRATVQLASLAKKAGVTRFLYSSSCSLYGVSGGGALTEESTLAPATAYAESKGFSERDLAGLADKNFAVTFLRNATAYGVSPKLRVDLVVNNMVGWAVSQGEIRILSDGSPWRPLVHVEDIALAFWAVAEAPVSDVAGQVFHVGRPGENFRVRDVADMVRRVVPGCRVTVTGEHGADSRSYQVDFSKIGRVLSTYRPKWTLAEGVEDLYRSYRDRGMSAEKFLGRSFVRLAQIKHLMTTGQLDNHLYWRETP
jgi:nucleoside-diphosphate-sugar epimerase